MKTSDPSETKTDPQDKAVIAPFQSRYRWVMVSLLCLLYVAFGLVARAIPPLVTPIVRDLRLSYTEMGFILGSWQLTYIVVSIIAGTVVDRWGVRKTLLAGTVVIGLSSALRYFPEGFAGMLGAVCLFGVGGSVISIGGPKAISIWFEGRGRGTAIGIFLTGSWVGSIFALALTNSLVMPLVGNRWREAFLLFGLFTFLVASLWWFFARDAESSASPSDFNAIEVFGRLFRVRQVQIVMALGLLTFASLHGFTNWLPRILEVNAFSPARAGFAASLPLLIGIPSMLVVPRLVPPRWRGPFLCFFSLGMLLALVLAVTTSGSLQLAALLVFGIIISPFVPVLVLILMDIPEVGSTYMGAAGGMFYCVSEIGGFAGPLVMGVLVDITGGFLAGVLFLAVLCIGIAVLTLSLKTRAAALGR